MGSSESKPLKLKSAFNELPDDTKHVLNSNLNHYRSHPESSLPKRIRSTLDSLLEKIHNEYSTKSVDVTVWAHLAFKLTSLDLNEKADFFQAYGELHGQDIKLFIQDVSSSLGLINISPSSSLLDFIYNQSFKSDNGLPNASLKYSDYLEWFGMNRFIQNLFNALFNYLFFQKIIFKLPQLQEKSNILSNLEHVYVLYNSIPPGYETKNWKLIFSSHKDGVSWTAFQSKIQMVGSCMIVVRDKEGYVFGAFSSKPIAPGVKFTGDSSTFLFTLLPKINVFYPTGINQNFQYFNYGQQTLPNGLGFGGQLDYFALWIDQSFLKGHSKGNPSTTFGNDTLSKSEEFVIDSERDDRFIDPAQLGAVNGNPEAVAFLEMAGKTLWTKNQDNGKGLEEENNPQQYQH